MADSFNILSSKITQLLYGRADAERALLNQTLEELNSLNYKYQIVTNPTKAVLLLNQCCTLIAPQDSELVLKCARLIPNLVILQNVGVEGRTLAVAIRWCLHALEDSPHADVLIALEALLRNNIQFEVISDILKSEVLKRTAKNGKNPELVLLSLQCFETCINPREGKNLEEFTPQLQDCFDIFLQYLQNHEHKSANLVSIKILSVCLHGLQYVILQTPLLQSHLGLILGIIKTYMVYSLKDVDFLAPQKLMPSALHVLEPIAHEIREKKGGKMTKQRKPKPQAIVNKPERKDEFSFVPISEELGRLKTSDSDFSDVEGGSLVRITVMAGRVRQAALSLFLHCIKITEKPVLFSYWTAFFPDTPHSSKHNLTTCFLSDSSTRGRMAALNVLLALLTSSKLYLAQAVKGENLAFTPFSVMIGLTIKELHNALCSALHENSIPVLVQVLKCLAALIQATPYNQLERGIISKVIRSVRGLMNHRDCTIQISVLIVFGCSLASEPPLPEIREAFQTKASEVSSNWLLERCHDNLKSTSSPLKMESLQILSAMSRNYFEEFTDLGLITEALDLALGDRSNDVRLHAGRAVDFMGQAMNRSVANLDDGELMHFWLTLINGSLTSLLQSEDCTILRGIGCDCLGSMGIYAFEDLPRDKQILCVTLLFACSRDPENGVRGAAVRALAIWVLYPSLREDGGFVVDTAEAIYRTLKDSNMGVRIKASWALGNLSDALVLNSSTASLADEIPDSLILKLLKQSILAAKDHDKIKMNSVRALGNFLQLITNITIEKDPVKVAIEDAIAALVKTSTSGSNMKVRWNSCYAIGNAMKNDTLYQTSINWRGTVFSALCELVVSFRNFKVRINAAVALAAPTQRSYYAQWYQPTCVALTTALETSQHMEDFNEYKHKDNLVEQICLSLGHLISLCTKADLIKLHYVFQSDWMAKQMGRVWERLLPEKTTILYEARAHVATLSEIPELNSDERNTLKNLNSILEYDL